MIIYELSWCIIKVEREQNWCAFAYYRTEKRHALIYTGKTERKFYNCKSVCYCKQRLFFTKIIKGQQLGHEHSLITYVHLLMSKQMTMYHRVFLFFLFSVPSVSPRPSAPLFLSFLKNLYIFFSIILSAVGSTFDK